MDSTSEERLRTVHPQLAERVRKMAGLLKADHDITIRVTQAFRTWQEQREEWLKGRDEQGNVVDPKLVVTKAPPGHSYHNFGLAVDVAPFEGAFPDWNRKHPVWKTIEQVGESVGLVAGAAWRTFPDMPHFQFIGGLPDPPDDSVRLVFLRSGVEGVWAQAGLNV